MSEGPRRITVGTIDNGATAIDADVTSLGSDVPVSVVLTTDYQMLGPPGYPYRPSFTGADQPQFPRTVLSGSTIAVLQAEATALIAANAATASSDGGALLLEDGSHLLLEDGSKLLLE
jgi:hypothetical protein